MASGIGKQTIRRLTHKNYYLARAYLNLKFYLSEFRGQEPLIIYQMGKVGSSTIAASLKALNLSRPIYHVHVLTPELIDKVEKMYYGRGMDIPFKAFLPRSKHIVESRFLRQRIDRGLNGKKWQVITLVREPIARNVSSFFQTFDLDTPDFIDKYRAGALNIDEFSRRFLQKSDLHESPLQWFDVQLKPVFGIDVFATDFPKTKGYKIYTSEHVSILVLKLERLSDYAREAFKEFLGIENFALVESNIASNKEYAAAYKNFIASVKLPAAYLDRMYQSKYARHFYTEEELDAFRAKWREG